MFWTSFKNWLREKRSPRRRKRMGRTLRPRLEQLEERLAPALGGPGPPPPMTAAGKVLLGVELQPISGVMWNVSALPNCSARRFISISDLVTLGLVTTPSILLAWA